MFCRLAVVWVGSRVVLVCSIGEDRLRCFSGIQL